MGIEVRPPAVLPQWDKGMYYGAGVVEADNERSNLIPKET
jgi:hypothetical protein